MRDLWITTSFLPPRREETLGVNFNHSGVGTSSRDAHPNVTVFCGSDAKHGESLQTTHCFQM
ncbi:hypothetical protein C7S15_8983 (plasmid) [Burkholderia cepacia]|nr:hypothetical protein [Burkholderia cepacia]